jgi:DNA helicase-2/ATP-dependent DNA helicase PcrA
MVGTVTRARTDAGGDPGLRAPAVAPQSGARGAEHLGLQVGDDVAHEAFGEGVILDVIGKGEDAEVVVRFRDAGEKRLILHYAPLKRLGA